VMVRSCIPCHCVRLIPFPAVEFAPRVATALAQETRKPGLVGRALTCLFWLS